MLYDVDPGFEYVRLILFQEEVETTLVVLLFDLIDVFQEVAVFFFQDHHGVCELLIYLRQRIQLPLIESIQAIHAGMTVGKLTDETGDTVVVSLIQVRILDVVETLHLHRFVQSIHHTGNKCSLLSGSVTPTKEDHPLLAHEDPLLVSALHHHHQLLRCVVFDILLVLNGSHRNICLLFKLILLFITIR